MEDGKWGHIEAGESGKEWNGMVAQASWGEVNFVICDMFLTFIRTQVLDGTVTFGKSFPTTLSWTFHFRYIELIREERK